MEFRAEITKTGSPEVIEFREFTKAPPGPGEVLIRHQAIGVNYIDVYYRNGIYPQATLPGKLGHEAAGFVEEIGQGVENLKTGDRVAYVSAAPGAYSTSRVLPANLVLKIPKELDFEIAAAMMLKGMTAQYLVCQTKALGPGDTLLYHAAAGGVGLIACQWAKHLGATVIGTVGSAEKAAQVTLRKKRNIPTKKPNTPHMALASSGKSLARRRKSKTKPIPIKGAKTRAAI